MEEALDLSFDRLLMMIKFHENPSSGSRVVPRGRTEMSQLTVTSRNFANGTKNTGLSGSLIYFRLLATVVTDQHWLGGGDRTEQGPLKTLSHIAIQQPQLILK